MVFTGCVLSCSMWLFLISTVTGSCKDTAGRWKWYVVGKAAHGDELFLEWFGVMREVSTAIADCRVMCLSVCVRAMWEWMTSGWDFGMEKKSEVLSLSKWNVSWILVSQWMVISAMRFGSMDSIVTQGTCDAQNGVSMDCLVRCSPMILSRDSELHLG
jgi:hypothetical protein